jgi:hypothetical protein
MKCDTPHCPNVFHGSAADAERIANWRIMQGGVFCPPCATTLQSGSNQNPPTVSETTMLRKRIGELQAEVGRLQRWVETLVRDNERLQEIIDEYERDRAKLADAMDGK